MTLHIEAARFEWAEAEPQSSTYRRFPGIKSDQIASQLKGWPKNLSSNWLLVVSPCPSVRREIRIPGCDGQKKVVSLRLTSTFRNTSCMYVCMYLGLHSLGCIWSWYPALIPLHQIIRRSSLFIYHRLIIVDIIPTNPWSAATAALAAGQVVKEYETRLDENLVWINAWMPFAGSKTDTSSMPPLGHVS